MMAESQNSVTKKEAAVAMQQHGKHVATATQEPWKVFFLCSPVQGYIMKTTARVKGSLELHC
jgi:hypothetical protein